MNRILTTILIMALTSGLLVGGCSSSAGPDGQSQAPQVGKLAPGFQLPDLDGKTVSLSELRGGPVMLNFWATWCEPCRSEMPYIQEIYDDRAWLDKGLVILAIDIGESQATAEDFMRSRNLSFPVLLDTNQEVALNYNIRVIPTTFLVDKEGIIRVMKRGAFPSKAAIEQDLARIIS